MHPNIQCMPAKHRHTHSKAKSVRNTYFIIIKKKCFSECLRFFHRFRLWFTGVILFQTDLWKSAIHQRLLGENSSTSAFLNESEFIHSKDKAVSIQGSLNPGLTLSGLQSCLPPPQCLLFFYSTESPQHQSGPWEYRDATAKTL